MSSFKTKKGVNSKVLSSTTSRWLGAKGAGSQKGSFVVGTPAKSSASSGPSKPSSFKTDDRLLQQKIERDTLKATPIPTKTIVFKTAPTPTKVKKPGIWSPTVLKITPYVAPKPTVKSGTYVAPKKSSGGGSSKSSSGIWGGTGSLKPTTSLSKDEKMKKGITSKSYTQGADQTPRNAPSYNK